MESRAMESRRFTYLSCVYSAQMTGHKGWQERTRVGEGLAPW